MRSGSPLKTAESGAAPSSGTSTRAPVSSRALRRCWRTVSVSARPSLRTTRSSGEAPAARRSVSTSSYHHETFWPCTESRRSPRRRPASAAALPGCTAKTVMSADSIPRSSAERALAGTFTVAGAGEPGDRGEVAQAGLAGEGRGGDHRELRRARRRRDADAALPDGLDRVRLLVHRGDHPHDALLPVAQELKRERLACVRADLLLQREEPKDLLAVDRDHFVAVADAGRRRRGAWLDVADRAGEGAMRRREDHEGEDGGGD